MSYDPGSVHNSGYHSFLEERDGGVYITIALLCDGKRAIEVDPIILAAVPAGESQAALARYAVWARSFCWYLNLGGTLEEARALLHLCSSLRRLDHPDVDLVAAFPSEEAPISVWKHKETGEFFKVVPGEEGFTEKLTEQELIESFSEEELKVIRVS